MTIIINSMTVVHCTAIECEMHFLRFIDATQ